MNRKKIFLILSAALILTSIVVSIQIKNFSDFKSVPDAQHYIAMSEGHSRDVLLPFAKRVLYPYLVSRLRPFIGTDAAFLLIGTISLFLFVFVVLVIQHHYFQQKLILCIALIFLPYLFLFYHDLYLPTLFFNALTCIYWFLIIRKRYLFSLFLLFVLYFVREESIIIALSFILAMLVKIFNSPEERKKYFVYILGTVLMIFLGWSIITYITRNNNNMERLPNLIYLIAKIPLYTMRNFLGFEHWVDVYKNLPSYTHPPILTLKLPLWICKISGIKQFGIYQWNFNNVINTLFFNLSSFGTGSTIMIYFFRKHGFKSLVKKSHFTFTMILLYGCLQFILSSLISFPQLRFYFNAWPMFFLIMPLFLKQIYLVNKRVFMRILSSYILSSWLIVVFFKFTNPIVFLGLITIEMILHWYTWRMLSVNLGMLDNKKVVAYDYDR